MSQNKFKWGIIGPGRIAHNFAEGLPAIDDATLYAVASRSRQRAEDFAAQYGAPVAYNSYDALLADPNVDAVYVATPHRYHAEGVLLCLEAGKPVLCEKPLTVNAAEARTLIGKSEQTGVFLMEALWSRHLPAYQQARKWIDEGRIGEIVNISSTFGAVSPSADPTERWYNPDLAGGVLLDMGIYNVAITQWLMGANPISVAAVSHMAASGVDDLTSAVLYYESGATAQFSTTFRAWAENSVYVTGLKGCIRVHPHIWQASGVTLQVGEEELTVVKPFPATGFEYQAMETMRCVREGLIESPTMTHADTLANMELLDGIRAQIGLRYPFE